MYVCMFVCMCMYVCMFVCMFVCMLYECMYVCGISKKKVYFYLVLRHFIQSKMARPIYTRNIHRNEYIQGSFARHFQKYMLHLVFEAFDFTPASLSDAYSEMAHAITCLFCTYTGLFCIYTGLFCRALLKVHGVPSL